MPAAIYDSGSGNVRIQITDLHGDVLGVTSNDLSTDPGILATFETDEYGVPRDPDDIGDLRYGYLGEHQRAADNPAGITLMGARLDNPTTGRFLQTDPVPGGSCNNYDYVCADPVNGTDLDGRCACTAQNQTLARYIGDRLGAQSRFVSRNQILIFAAVVFGVSWVWRNRRYIWATSGLAAVAYGYWFAKKSRSSGKQKASDVPS